MLVLWVPMASGRVGVLKKPPSGLTNAFFPETLVFTYKSTRHHNKKTNIDIFTYVRPLNQTGEFGNPTGDMI